MKKKVKFLNLVICSLALLTTLVMIFTIAGVGYDGGVVSKSMYHTTLVLMLISGYSGLNIYALTKEG